MIAERNIPTPSPLPSSEALRQVMTLIRQTVFPEIYGNDDVTGEIARLLADATGSDDIARAFVLALPDIRRLLQTDTQAIIQSDPAAHSFEEVVLSYPSVTVMLHYRTAHFLHVAGVPLVPRMLTEQAHSATGIDIHPAAQIGEYFAIDHGTGIVVGETTIIGRHVLLYQGVTLGARKIRFDASGQPLNQPRHPIIEDNVTIYSNATILGRVRIGHDSVIGGNVWLTHDVPPHSKVVQGELVTEQFFTNGGGI